MILVSLLCTQYVFRTLTVSQTTLPYGVNVGDGEKDTIVRGFWRRICGLFAEQI